MTWFAVGGAIVVGVGALVSAHAKKNAAEYNQGIAEQNAKIAVDQANVNETAQRRRAAIQIGRQVSATAENAGLSGTGLDLIGQSTAEAEMDALNIRYGGQLGKISGEAQGKLYSMQADDAETAGYLNAGSAALSGYGSYTKNKGLS
jgi:hypothetical protein